MNDLGLDRPIQDAADQVADKYNKHGSGPEIGKDGDEKNVFLPAKWWWASTVFPLLAGTFGPMANAFSICALVESWREELSKSGTEEHGIKIKDPNW
jgi:potassium channel subfamily K, other eukaryote